MELTIGSLAPVSGMRHLPLRNCSTGRTSPSTIAFSAQPGLNREAVTSHVTFGQMASSGMKPADRLECVMKMIFASRDACFICCPMTDTTSPHELSCRPSAFVSKRAKRHLGPFNCMNDSASSHRRRLRGGRGRAPETIMGFGAAASGPRLRLGFSTIGPVHCRP